MTDPLKFLHAVWKLQPDGHFFLAHFDEAHIFRERSFPRETDDQGWTDYKRKPSLRVVGNGIDLYFCPNSFTETNRRNSFAQEGRWLYADLDEADPSKLPSTLKPTIAWITSPGRYQAMWLLDKPLPPDKLALTNQWMTYETGADKGGWSLTKVLRVPGSVSHKREKPFNVRLLWADGPRYPSESLYERAKAARRSPVIPEQAAEADSARQLRKKYWSALPGTVRKLLRTKREQTSGDRSQTLWKLENLLLEAGLHPAEVFVLAKASAWNKYRGQQREEAMLWAEVMRASARHVQDRPLPVKAKKRLERAEKELEERREAKKPKPIPLARFMAMDHPEPSWLVKDIWTTGAYGVWAGAWKSFKSTSLYDLILSVASGKKFLDKFDVPRKGAVLYVHEEGTTGFVKNQLARIMNHKHLDHKVTKQHSNGNVDLHFSANLPVHLWSFPGLDLTTEESQLELEEQIRLLKPKLVVLETLYLLIGNSDENSAQEMKPVLEYMSYVSRTYGTALIVSHHYNKGSDSSARALGRLSGSGVFGRWVESAVFCERVGEESDSTIIFHSEHRAQPGQGKVNVQFEFDEDTYRVNILESNTGGTGDNFVMPPQPQTKSRTRRKREEPNKDTKDSPTRTRRNPPGD